MTNVIISLTSYPARINTVHLTIQTLLKQTRQADKVILWLAPEQFPHDGKKLPQQLLDLQDKGLSIRWYHDIKSYKKLVPALREYPDDIIVTADDDILYAQDWLEKLLISYEKEPEYIHCHRCHRIRFKNKHILPYKKWYHSCNVSSVSFNNFLTGGGGALYPPRCLSSDIYNEELFKELCPLADDIWFWAMAVLNGTRIKIIENAQTEPFYIDGTQEEALCKINTGEQNMNDTQLAKVLQRYPEIMERLDKIQKDAIVKIKIRRVFGYPVLKICRFANGSKEYYLFNLPLCKIP